jgi:pimeloyl-ACP methyl ester carboxylesterase
MIKWCHLVLVTLAGVLISSGALAADPSGRLVDLPNTRLWIVDSGGPGEPVILLHPRTGNSEYWQYTVKALSEAGYRAIAIDYPGWGKSILKPGQNLVPIAETIDALVDTLQLDQIHIVGTAMGGYIALDYAVWRPERVKTLVIASSGLGLENDPEVDAFRKRAEIPGMAQQPSEIREVSPNYRGMNPQGLALWKTIHDNGQHKDTVPPPLRSPNTPEKLASNKAPALIIAGGIDLVTPSGSIRLWSRHLTVEHDFLVMPEAGHVLVWEQPEVFNPALISFLKKH